MRISDSEQRPRSCSDSNLSVFDESVIRHMISAVKVATARCGPTVQYGLSIAFISWREGSSVTGQCRNDWAQV